MIDYVQHKINQSGEFQLLIRLKNQSFTVNQYQSFYHRLEIVKMMKTWNGNHTIPTKVTVHTVVADNFSYTIQYPYPPPFQARHSIRNVN